MKKIISQMKRAVITLSIVTSYLFSQTADAQQIPQFTQYMLNTYVYNPAVAGTYNYYQIRLNNRYQWAGMNDAPQTTSISLFGPLSKRDMGWGSYIYMDATGPTSRMGLMGSYSYNMDINDEYRISGGLSFGFMQYKVDGSKLSLGENLSTSNDPAIFSSSQASFNPDASVGFYLYSSMAYVGVSAHQLFGQKLKISDSPTDYENRLKQHIMLSGSYRFIFSKDYDFEPSLLLKYMFKSKMQVELSTKVTYKAQVWGGVSYRYNDAIALMVGYNYKKRYIIGYSYDYSYTDIRNYQTGSHEIMLGYLFDKIK